MSFAPLRQAATRSVRQSVMTSRMSLPLTGLTSRRLYSATTDDNKPPTDEKKPEDQAATNEEKAAPLSPEEELKLKLTEKDKKLAELQVSQVVE